MRTVVKKVEPVVADPWMSVLEAGRVLKCSPQTVLKRALRGELETSFVANRTVISRASVEAAVGKDA